MSFQQRNKHCNSGENSGAKQKVKVLGLVTYDCYEDKASVSEHKPKAIETK